MPARLERTAQGREGVGRNSAGRTARLTRWDGGTTLVNGAGATYPLVAGARLSERVRARACGCRAERRAEAGRKVRGVAARNVHRRRSRARHVQLGGSAGAGARDDLRAGGLRSRHLGCAGHIDRRLLPWLLDQLVATISSSGRWELGIRRRAVPPGVRARYRTQQSGWPRSDIEQRSVEIPFYVDATQGSEASLGAYKLVACLASPYVPVAEGGAPDNLRVTELELALSEPGRSVITKPASGKFTWRLFTTPYVNGTATPDDGRHVRGSSSHAAPARNDRARAVPAEDEDPAHNRPRPAPRQAGARDDRAGGGRGSNGPISSTTSGRRRRRAAASTRCAKPVALGRRARKLRVYVFGAEARGGACVEPSVAPVGCVHREFLGASEQLGRRARAKEAVDGKVSRGPRRAAREWCPPRRGFPSARSVRGPLRGSESTRRCGLPAGAPRRGRPGSRPGGSARRCGR